MDEGDGLASLHRAILARALCQVGPSRTKARNGCARPTRVRCVTMLAAVRFMTCEQHPTDSVMLEKTWPRFHWTLVAGRASIPSGESISVDP